MTEEEAMLFARKELRSAYERAEKVGHKGKTKYIEVLEMVIKILEQEPKTDVLDKIRAEIDRALSRETLSDNRQQISDVGIGLELALSIIDKYNAESEDKE